MIDSLRSSASSPLFCTAASVEFWLRRGSAVDFFLGRITREHEDIDLFVWGNDAPRLLERLHTSALRKWAGRPREPVMNYWEGP